jgi:hypothetical protein
MTDALKPKALLAIFDAVAQKTQEDQTKPPANTKELFALVAAQFSDPSVYTIFSNAPVGNNRTAIIIKADGASTGKRKETIEFHDEYQTSADLPKAHVGFNGEEAGSPVPLEEVMTKLAAFYGRTTPKSLGPKP